MTSSLMQRGARMAFAALPILLAAACQTPSQTSAPVAANPAPQPVAEAPANNVDFPVWLAAARQEALKRGISEGTLSEAFAGLSPNPRVIELDGKQPEFSSTFWRYLDNAVSDTRVSRGRALMQQNAGLLHTLEGRYGVPGRYLVAFWGIETDFGRNTGDFSVVRSLATLAYDGRRGAYFRGEMFDALTILDHRDIDNGHMTGSWAGAMGQAQFMPSAFLKYAVDEDGDGRRNIWTSVPDALASVANYMKSSGWEPSRGWGYEVRLPTGFDAGLASLDTDANEAVKGAAQWASLGVRRTDGGPLAGADGPSALILPAGISGPAFLVSGNYRTILKYNRSTFYALAVGYLADRLAGAPALTAPHGSTEPLKREDILALQQGLQTLGLLPGTPDGVAGNATRQAVRTFQRANGLAPDGFIDQNLIAAVKARSGVA
ncbi:MAG TPA: lytic murein transglycosylase [Alphaproteobacteria bacterium]|jgi:membrane-bound lytic murein transglycosylase B|nr:lytic murein transglycosylase [Alphaproteobacteria bacterium]